MKQGVLKDGKVSYDKPKYFRPISLMPFILKFLEKLIDRNIRDKISGTRERSNYMQTEKNSSIHQLVTKVERTLVDDSTIFLVAIDAFDNIIKVCIAMWTGRVFIFI